MAVSLGRSVKSMIIFKEPSLLAACRAFSAGGTAKKGSNGDAAKTSAFSKEVKSSTTMGANILKDDTDLKLLPNSEYPDWLWHLIDKRAALSELKRKGTENFPYKELKRFLKLDNHARIMDNNSVKAKN